MASVIDELIIKIGLDPKGVEDGQRRTSEALKKTGDQAATLGKGMMAEGKNAAEFFSQVKVQALGLMGVLAGTSGLGATIAKIGAGVRDVSNAAETMNMPTRDLKAWNDVLEKLTGHADSATGTMKTLSAQMAAFRRGEASPEFQTAIGRIGGTGQETQQEILEKLTKWFNDKNNTFSDEHKVETARWITGGNDDFIVAMRRGTEELKKMLSDAKVNMVDDKGIEDTKRLMEQVGGLQKTISNLMERTVAKNAPWMKDIVEFMDNMINRDKPFSEAALTIGTAVGILASGWVTARMGARMLGIGGRGVSQRAIRAAAEKAAASAAEKTAAATAASAAGSVAAPAAAVAGRGLMSRMFGPFARLLGLATSGPAMAAGMMLDPSSTQSQEMENRLIREAMGKPVVQPGETAPEPEKPEEDDLYKGDEADPMIVKMTNDNIADLAGAFKRVMQEVFGAKPANAEDIDTDTGRGEGGGKGGVGGEEAAGDSSGKGGSLQPPIPYTPGDLMKTMGITAKDYDALRNGVAAVESGGSYNPKGSKSYSGRYQMGDPEIREAALALGETPPSTEQFRGDPAMQERYWEAYMMSHHRILMKNPRYAGMSNEEKLRVLGMSQLGLKRTLSWLNTGSAKPDGNGTPIQKWYDAVRRQQAGPRASTAPTTTQPGGDGTLPPPTLDIGDPSLIPRPAGLGPRAQNSNMNVGNIHVYTQASDSAGIAREIHAALADELTQQATRGLV